MAAERARCSAPLRYAESVQMHSQLRLFIPASVRLAGLGSVLDTQVIAKQCSRATLVTGGADILGTCTYWAWGLRGHSVVQEAVLCLKGTCTSCMLMKAEREKVGLRNACSSW